MIEKSNKDFYQTYQYKFIQLKRNLIQLYSNYYKLRQIAFMCQLGDYSDVFYTDLKTLPFDPFFP